MELQLIRNATLKVTFGGSTFLIDPYFAEKHSQPSFGGRSNNPTVNLPFHISAILEDVDFVLISHLHLDHFDSKAQEVIPKHLPIYCQPEDLESIRGFGFQYVTEITHSFTLKDLLITRTPCQHGSGGILPLMGTASGFVFQHPDELTLYWCGDTIWYAAVEKVIDQFQPSTIVCHALKITTFLGMPFRVIAIH